MIDVESVEDAKEAIRWARDHHQPFAILGGGSNVVVSDAGFDGLVMRIGLRGIDLEEHHGEARVSAAAGEPWDEFVGSMVDEDLVGLECLSGIPGLVGATPIQNVGAYGQEVGNVVEGVRVLDLVNLEETTMGPEACRFGYRSSTFRESPGRYLVLKVIYRLRRGGQPRVEYEELRRKLGGARTVPGASEVRNAVLSLRREKSMVIHDEDPNRRSVGSFFVNPVIDLEKLEALRERARSPGLPADAPAVPTYPAGEGQVKISAAWLIERAGFARAMRRGAVGVSSAHALALVHHGGGSTSELVALAREIREGVLLTFGIELRPEPVFLGFPTANPLTSKVER